MKILLVDDEKSLRIPLADELRDAGYQLSECSDGKEAIALLSNAEFDIIICDLVMKELGGMDVLRYVKGTTAQTAFILMTAYATIETAVEALKIGAMDIICKPFEMHRLFHLIENTTEIIRLRRENKQLKNCLEQRSSYHRIIGKSSSIQKTFELLEAIEGSDTTVLIQGETGTGKQLFAEAIHYNSNRCSAPLITVSCAALPETLLESELFGHEKGAFTGALQARKGRFELADGGTLFLDEVDDMPKIVQTKLLRFLQSGEFERVGGEVTLQVNVRVIAATKCDLRELAKSGEFRLDLYYRLHVIPLKLPPLRERIEDIPLLVDHFAKKYSPQKAVIFSDEVLDRLMSYEWEGNIRELEHVIEKLILLSKNGEIPLSLLPGHIKDENPVTDFFLAADISLPQYLENLEKSLLVQALNKCESSKTQACKILGIPLPTLKSKLQKYGL